MAQATEDATPHLLPAFWPLADRHAVSHVALDTEPPSNAERVLPLLLRLAAQSDAMRSLQTGDGAILSERGASALRQEMAESLTELAELGDEESAVQIRLRAEVLAGDADEEEVTRRIAAEGAAPPLEIVCGPLCTWRPKTRSPLHSFVAAAHDGPVQEVLDALDAATESALDELRADLDAPQLRIECEMPMHATDLIVSAGEAAGHPKHFAYFLPQDEDVDYLPLEEQRTLYLHNVHRVRFQLITAPLGEALLDGPLGAGATPTEATLTPWIRGHDHGHNLAVPETDYESWSGTLGLEPFMMLQEAIANVYGFLMSVSEPWLGIAGVSRLEMCATHVAELLHYMRRGPSYFGDPGAAYLELSFLAENGFVEVDGDGRVAWTEEDFWRGMVELAKALTESTVGAADERPSETLIDRYSWPHDAPSGQRLDTAAGRTLTAIREELAHVPTSVAFYRTDAPHGAAA